MKAIIERIEATDHEINIIQDLILNRDLKEATDHETAKLNELEKKLNELNQDLERFEEIEDRNDQINDDLKIAIEDWGLYNNGVLACKWWDYDSDITDIEDYYILIRKYNDLDVSNEIELFIADYDTPVNNAFSEKMDIDKALEQLSELNSISEDEYIKINFLMEHYFQSFDEALYNYKEVIIYKNMDFEDLAKEYIDSNYDLQKEMGDLASYFNYEAFGRDMKAGGNFAKIGNDIYSYIG